MRTEVNCGRCGSVIEHDVPDNVGDVVRVTCRNCGMVYYAERKEQPRDCTCGQPKPFHQVQRIVGGLYPRDIRCPVHGEVVPTFGNVGEFPSCLRGYPFQALDDDQG